MRDSIQKELKSYFANHLKEKRKSKNLSQMEMAEILDMDMRSYSDIENGKNMCGTVTFILFVLYVNDDIKELFSDIAKVIERTKGNVA